MTNATRNPADALIAALHEPGRENLLDLVQNPLRLTMLCMTWDGSSLPDTQAELYDRYLRKIYGWNRNLHELEDHAERCGTTTTKLKQDLNQQLGKLAKAALNLPQERFRLSQALVEQHLGEESDRTSLAYLALRLGWLNRVGRDGRSDAIFAFYHATFQEYFAALAVEDWDYFLPKDHVDCPVAGKRYRIFEKQWKQVILLWLGRGDIEAEKKEGFIRALVEFEDGVGDIYEYQAYFLAAAGINEFKACSLAAEIVRQLVKWGFGYFNIEKQEWRTFLDPIKKGARKTIPETIRRLAIPELSAIIENCPDEYIRRKVAESLGEIDPGNLCAIAALIKLIETTENGFTPIENEYIRMDASESLGKIDPGNPEAIEALLELLCTSKDEYIRKHAAVILEKTGQGNPQAINGLLQVLCTAKSKWSRVWSLNTLRKIAKKNPEAINKLLQILRTTDDSDTCRRVAVILEEIAPGNPEAINGLLEILRTTENADTRRRAAESLWEIAPGNPEAIKGLLEILHTTENADTYRQASENLENIAPENIEAINGLLQILRTTEDKHTRWWAAHSLGKIAPGNIEVIAGLIELLRTTKNVFIRMRAVETLEKIALGNIEAITGLLQIIRTTEDGRTQLWTARTLGTIAPGNIEAIAGLVEIIRTTEDGYTRTAAAESLEKIAPGNIEAITGLLQIIRTTEDRYTRTAAAESLEKIAPENPEAIAALIEVIRTTEDVSTRMQAAESLGKIDPGNPEAITGLLKVIRTTENESSRCMEAESLGKIGQGNPEAIAALVNLIATTEYERTRREAAESLKKILTKRQHYAGVVSALKHNLSDEVSQSNFDRFNECYKLIWNCAENLPYPDFYQAWHNPPTTPHPEVEDNTPATPTPFTQQCNLALLPQILNQAIQTHPVNRQPICIDGSRFSDPSNPALQIYTTLKKAGCPASPDGKPDTIAKLQAYCEDDLSDHQIALILYEEPTDPPPQGFDIAVLNQLARFSHPPIAVVVPQPLPDCRLPQFLESDPDLMATLLQWLQNLNR